MFVNHFTKVQQNITLNVRHKSEFYQNCNFLCCQNVLREMWWNLIFFSCPPFYFIRTLWINKLLPSTKFQSISAVSINSHSLLLKFMCYILSLHLNLSERNIVLNEYFVKLTLSYVPVPRLNLFSHRYMCETDDV